jgi:hypothetical protein
MINVDRLVDGASLNLCYAPDMCAWAAMFVGLPALPVVLAD